MSSIFDLTTIISENANNLFKTNIANTNGSSYLESAFQTLSDLSNSHNSAIMELYSVMNEADDKSKENDCLCKYFEEVNKLISKFNKNIEELVSRFIINIDNIVDANSDLLDNNDIITQFKPFSYRYKMFNIDNISNPDFPRLDVLSIYKKEFDFIGQLMQDLGHGATNTSKLEVIATVYNKLNTSAANMSVTKKCIDSIIGIDKDNNIETFTTDLYNKFSNSDDLKDVVINKSIMYNLKTSLANYKTLENSGVASVENLIKQFDQIIAELKEILHCNKNHTLKIDTETDGIKNTTYSMDTYSMNQLDLFMKAKINQIMEMINIYTIAVSIKLDAITDYFEQCKDIIHIAEMSCNDSCDDNSSDNPEDDSTEINTDEDPSANDNNTSMADTTVSSLSNDDDDTDNDDEPDDEYNISDDDKTQDNSSDDNNNNDDSSEDNDNVNDNVDDTSIDENIKDADSQDYSFDDIGKDLEQSTQEAVRQFTYDLYAIQEQYRHLSLLEQVIAITEDDAANNSNPPATTQAPQSPATQDQQNNNSDNNKDTIMNKAKASADVKETLWRKIVNKIAELWNKFKNNFTTTYNDKIKKLDEYASYYKKPAHDFAPDSGKMMLKMHPENITKIKLPDANFNNLKDKLKDEDTFFSSFAQGVKRDNGQSISDAVKNFIIEPDQYYKNMNELNPQQLYDWCKNSTKVIDELKKQTDTINKGRRNAEAIAKQYQESGILDLDHTLGLYFNEADFKSDKEDEKTKPIVDGLMVYFNVCGKVLAAEMTCCHKIFNEYYSYLIEHAKKYGAGGGTQEKNNADNNANNNAADNDSEKDVSFD